MTALLATPAIPAELADCAMINGKAAAAAAGISISHWLDLVKRGEAPQPLRFGPRCTRWTMSSVREWLIQRAEMAEADQRTSERLTARAKHASNAAQAKRQARQQASAMQSVEEVCA